MAQQYRREVTHFDEQGNPVRITDEHGNIVHSDTGIRIEREVRHTGEHGITDEFGNPIHPSSHATSGDRSVGAQRGSTKSGTMGQGLGQANRGTGTGTGSTYSTAGHQGLGTNVGHVTGGTGTDYDTYGGRSVGQTGYQGLGTEGGSATGGGLQEGHGQANRGSRTGTGGQEGLSESIDHATWGTGTGNMSGGRSVGQTGYQGLGTERGSGGVGYGGIGDQQQTRAATGETREKKGMMEKIKEKLPGNQ